MKILIVYVLIILISPESVRSENSISNTLDGFTAGPILRSEPESSSFAEVYDENPTFAKIQAMLGNFRNDPDVARTCGQIIKSRGFGVERHYVITVDGYIIQVHRIINPYAKAALKCQKPVLLAHGLLESCINSLYAGPDGHIKPWINGNPPNDNSTSLGFLLANEGFDVWIISFRGTSYSTNHTYLDPNKDPEFWDFSFQDIAFYDVPAVVEYTKKITRRDQVTLVCHSQGAIQANLLMSAYPEYQKNFDLVVQSAPIGFLGNLKSLLGTIPHEPPINAILSTLKIPFPPALEYFNTVISPICTSQVTIPICVEVFSAIVGTEGPQINGSRLSVTVTALDRTSVKNIAHYFQSQHRDHISYFSYDIAKNIDLYGTPEAPNFPFHRIDARKIALISSLDDFLATPVNVLKFVNSLNGTVLVHHIIQTPLWGHLGYLYAIEQYKYFGKVVLDMIRKYGSN